MDADAGRVRTALRLQAVAARVHHMDCAGFAEEVCDAVDVAGRLGYLGCLHAVVRLAAAREAMPWISRGGRIDLSTKSRRCAWPT